MNLDKVRARPFLLLLISDAVEEGFLTQAQVSKIESQLVDMSLNIAKSFFSPIISHDLKKSCSIVLGVTTLGLLKLSGGDTLNARRILLEDSVIICFRKGWESVDSLFKAHGAEADRAKLLFHYQYSDNELKDIVSIHESLLSKQLDFTLLTEIATDFKNPMSGMDMFDQDEELIKADVQLSIFEALMKRHAIDHTHYDDLKALLIAYRDKPDIFADEFSEATEAILERFGGKVSLRIEGWLPSIKDDFHTIFEKLSFENSGPNIYILFFEKILRGNINPNKFMHAFESLSESEKKLHTDLKKNIDTETSYQDLEEEDSDFPDDHDLSDYSQNTSIDY